MKIINVLEGFEDVTSWGNCNTLNLESNNHADKSYIKRVQMLHLHKSRKHA
jgi:hypothetical protein